MRRLRSKKDRRQNIVSRPPASNVPAHDGHESLHALTSPHRGRSSPPTWLSAFRSRSFLVHQWWVLAWGLMTPFNLLFLEDSLQQALSAGLSTVVTSALLNASSSREARRVPLTIRERRQTMDGVRGHRRPGPVRFNSCLYLSSTLCISPCLRSNMRSMARWLVWMSGVDGHCVSFREFLRATC